MIKVYAEMAVFPTYVETGLVTVLSEKPNIAITIERNSCACGTRDGIAVMQYSIFIKNLDRFVTSHENYILKCKLESEMKTTILWLVKSQFLTFDYSFENYQFKRCMSQRFFYIYPLACGCTRYELKGEPVYCLKSIVVSANRTGPTILSTIDKN